VKASSAQVFFQGEHAGMLARICALVSGRNLFQSDPHTVSAQYQVAQANEAVHPAAQRSPQPLDNHQAAAHTQAPSTR